MPRRIESVQQRVRIKSIITKTIGPLQMEKNADHYTLLITLKSLQSRPDGKLKFKSDLKIGGILITPVFSSVTRVKDQSIMKSNNHPKHRKTLISHRPTRHIQ